MEAFTTLNSLAVPLPMNDVDTDLIIPAQYLTSVSREGYGQNLFRRLRDTDPNFIFNQAKYRDGKILIASANFGCGSSREHAVWALMGWGIRVVIAKSFADIFSGNSAKNGLLTIVLPEKSVDTLLGLAAEGRLEVSVDLAAQTVEAQGTTFEFEYDPFRKHCLLHGLDDINYILSESSSIENYRKAHEPYRFFSTMEPK